MTKPWRTSRILTVAGVVVCALLAFTSEISYFFGARYANNAFHVKVAEGEVEFHLKGPRSPKQEPHLVTWEVSDRPFDQRIRHYFGIPEANYGTVRVPLGIPLFLAVVFTRFLTWREGRRFPCHGCQVCAYDLTGNMSGVCPECGTKIAS
ncbi:MAG: hypothetical protein MI923_00080 [Phycisphaerales bacterium]|nr:hypothetical protein [Phycisphaerales bacterium]